MFNETRLLDCVAYGSEFGQEFNTRVVQLRSGVESRNANWSMPLGRYGVLFQSLKPEDHSKVRAAFMTSMGRLIGFRFKDWTDYQVSGQQIGVATGVSQTLQLYKEYQFGPLTLTRPIVKPVQGTVSVFANGVEIASTLDSTTGLVSFTATAAEVITWGGEFDVPVRFDSDRLDLQPVGPSGADFLLSSNADLTEIRL